MNNRNHPTAAELRFPVGQQLKWQLPAGRGGWLEELQEMRGRVLYAEGRRPSFRLADGSFADANDVDLSAYHLLVRCDERIVACARILHPIPASSTVVSSTGPDHVGNLLHRRNVMPDDACEASRWVVEPDFRKLGLGLHVVAASWAVAQWLGVKLAFVMAGTRDRQDRMLMRMGAHAVDDLAAVRSELYDDDLRLLYFDVAHPTSTMIGLINASTRALSLECLLDRNVCQETHRIMNHR